MINCPVRTPSSYAYTGIKYRRRWKFEKEEELDEEWKRAWAEEWDREREKKLRGSRGGSAAWIRTS